MIIPLRPMRLVGGSKPCGCGGKCPYGFPEGRCPASTASAWQAYVPEGDAGKNGYAAIVLEPRIKSLRPEDV
jgi:hypothetical protein